MKDEMLTELYKRAFQTKAQVERLNSEKGENYYRLRQEAIAKNELLGELIDIRTEQLKRGV